MPREVVITREGKLDILNLWNCMAETEGLNEADALIKKIENIIYSLAEFAERGHIPPELERVDEFNYLEVYLLPYRIIFKITKEDVIILCVLDGRRDMKSLLYERLIRKTNK